MFDNRKEIRSLIVEKLKEAPKDKEEFILKELEKCGFKKKS